MSRNTAEFCIDLHRKISYNFAKFGSFSNGIRNKKNIRNIRNFDYAKCRKHTVETIETQGRSLGILEISTNY
jgi:hypothetical protein